MKNTIKLALIAATMFTASCSKDALTPSLGLDSNLKVENLKIQNFTTDSSAIVTGNVKFYFIKANDTVNNKMDTITSESKFNIPTTSGFTQSLNFDTPEGALYLNLDFSVNINGGKATAVTFDKLHVDYNDKSYLDTAPMSLKSSNSSDFELPTQTVKY